MKIIQNIRYLFQLLWNHNKKYFWVTALAFLLPAVTNLIQVVFPREILESLEEAADFTGTVILAVAMHAPFCHGNAVLLCGVQKAWLCGGL